MAARSLPEMAEYRQKMKLPPFVSCFIPGYKVLKSQPTKCSPEGWWVVGGWWMAARSLPEMAEYRQKMKLHRFVSFFIPGYKALKNQLTAPRAPGVLLYVLLHFLFPVSYKVLKNQPTNCSPRTRCAAVRTAALLCCCM